MIGERQLQRKLYVDYYGGSDVLVPNYTPAGWWECDLFRVTRAGYFYEYEIKLNQIDFNKDKNKNKHIWNKQLRMLENFNKYELLENTDNGPSRFYYVVTEDIVEYVEKKLPAWAGLIVFNRHLKQVVPAPRRHKLKIAPTIIDHSKEVCVHRFWNERYENIGLRKLNRDLMFKLDKLTEAK